MTGTAGGAAPGRGFSIGPPHRALALPGSCRSLASILQRLGPWQARLKSRPSVLPERFSISQIVAELGEGVRRLPSVAPPQGGPASRGASIMRSRRRRARIAASSAGLLVVASLGAPALSEADRRDANGRLAPAPLHVLEARNGGGSLTAGADWSRDPGRVVDLLGVAEAPRLRWQAVMQNAARLETGAIGGRFVACSGTVASVQVSVEGGGAQSALSGPTGAFELKDVPPGTFDLIVEAGGQRATISGIRVVSGRTTDIGEINLTDFGADPKHCGACGKRCPPGASCVYGVCICPAGLMVCGDTCTTLADLEHCRACQNRCAAWPNMIPQCGAQDCVYRCVDGTADCDGRRTTGCEIRIDSDVNNCGACGNSCAPGQRCVKSRCQ